MVNLEQLNYSKKKSTQLSGEEEETLPKKTLNVLNELGNQLKVFFGLFICSKFSIIYHLF